MRRWRAFNAGDGGAPARPIARFSRHFEGRLTASAHPSAGSRGDGPEVGAPDGDDPAADGLARETGVSAAPAGALPISDSEFDALVKEIRAPRRLAVAVSGGVDSMALAVLAAGAARRGVLAPIVFTVDHGLRPEAFAEAELTAARCRSMGLESVLLRWTGDKPRTGLQAAARSARYRMLATAAVDAGCEAIATAHTADDQAETVFMRLARGAGPAGAGGMPARSRIADGPGPAVSLLRPFLAVRRLRLVATREAFGVPCVHDPSNDDPAFERVRMRALLGALAEQNLISIEALCQTASRARAAREALDHSASTVFAAGGGVIFGWGGAAVDVGALGGDGVSSGGAGGRDNAGLDAAVGARLLARLVFALGGGDSPPSAAACGAACAALLQGEPSVTLGGAFLRRQGARLLAYREPASARGRAGVDPIQSAFLEPGARLLWDRRYIIENNEKMPLEIAPLWPVAGGVALAAQAGRLNAAPADAFAASPVVLDGAAIISAPALGRQAPHVAVRSIIEERFSDRVIRF